MQNQGFPTAQLSLGVKNIFSTQLFHYRDFTKPSDRFEIAKLVSKYSNEIIPNNSTKTIDEVLWHTVLTFPLCLPKLILQFLKILGFVQRLKGLFFLNVF